MSRYQVFSLLTGEFKGQFGTAQDAINVSKPGDYIYDTVQDYFTFWYPILGGTQGCPCRSFPDMLLHRQYAKMLATANGYFAYVYLEGDGEVVKTPARQDANGDWEVFWSGTWHPAHEHSFLAKVQEIKRFTDTRIYQEY